ncbi:pyocin activator PrtN family protein [Agarivorans sp. QJM3NY_29]|uniref:pyocin activator PrtN family protein n=1 Tax=Alteromonadales TaxID=135622 RepID=UPI000AB91B05|nr:pyocin activator PrtN family protein [Moritella viscosa]
MKKSDEPTLTHMILLQQFNYRALIPVEELAEPYLNLARRTALNRAKTHSLPFPCFRVGDTQKSPYVVALSDLVEFIDRRIEEERSLWKSFQIG